MASPPPPAPPAAAEDEERPWPPPMKMKLGPYAMYCVFEGLGPAATPAAAAYLAMHIVMYAVRFLSYSPVAERARFWGLVHTAVASVCWTATALILCVFVRKYMDVDGVYVLKELDPSQQPPPAASEQIQLPPPPPEMDMC